MPPNQTLNYLYINDTIDNKAKFNLKYNYKLFNISNIRKMRSKLV